MKNLLLLLFLSFSLQAQESLNVDLLFNYLDESLPLNYRDSRHNEVWGFVWEDNEYAVIGSTLGTHIYNVTYPEFSWEVDFVAASVQGWAPNHRDFHDYNGYLYAVGDQNDGADKATLQIIDLHYLPDSVHLVYDSNELINRAHNIFIDTATAKLYVAGATHLDNTAIPLEVFTLQNPEDPQYIGEFTESGYIHDLYVRNDTAYCHQPYTNIFYVVSFSDPANPVILGSLDSYPDQAVCHSGWLTDDGNYYVFADESPGKKLKICDVSDLSDIQVIATFGSEVTSQSIAHNPIIKGDFVHISYYNDGYWIFDISDPYQPTLAGYYDTFPSAQSNDNRGAWGVYPYLPSGNVLISDRNNGLFVLDPSEALGENPTGISETPLPTQNIKVYPQPAAHSFVIELPATYTSHTECTLFDLYGKMYPLQLAPLHANSFQVAPENPMLEGMFFLKIKNGRDSEVVKVLLER